MSIYPRKKRLLSPNSIQSDVWHFIFIWNLSKSQLGTICIIMILDVGWLILQGSQINCILKVVRLIALNKEALRMQQRVMIKVYDYDQKGKNSIINNCGSCHLENAAANKRMKNSFTFCRKWGFERCVFMLLQSLHSRDFDACTKTILYQSHFFS